ncbi:MAG: rhodanese-like domain-containing protein [Ferruginibacter sp.]
MNIITAIELVQLIKANADIQLIDVRETTEHQEFNIGGELIPLQQIIQHIHRIEKEKQVIIYCKKGVRSHIAIQRLQNKFPFQNLVNLAGGMDAWIKMFTL